MSSLQTLLSQATNPAALAASLVQQSTAAYAPAVCSKISGYEHCEKCAMPIITKLVDELIGVKLNIWKTRTTAKTSANKVCTSAAPGDRRGGYGKCCSKNVYPTTPGQTSRQYSASGYVKCLGPSTFSPTVSFDASKLTGDRFTSYKWTGVSGSTMVKDCCAESSTCDVNQKTFTTRMDAHMVTVNDLALKEKSLYEKNAALTLRISKIAGEITALKQQADQVCVGAVLKVGGKWDVASCTAGSIKDSLATAAVNSARVTRDAASMAEAIKIVSKVMRWLDTGVKDGKEQVFTKSSHGTGYQANGPAPAAMVALLEEAHASATSKVAQEALSKAMELVQAAKGSRISQVHSIFLKLIQRLEESRTKMVKYAKQVTDEANANAQTLFEKRVTVLALAATKTGEQSTMESTKAANTVAIASLPQQVTDEKALYMVDRKLREDNTKKCAAFMNFYDAETQTSTAELLILKKAIDIIRHIKCTTNPPTGAPTAFPTAPPTAFPTAQPTNAPTAYPTAAPTAAPTSYPTVAFCAAGDYKFMSKVFTGDFAKRSMYSVPVYAKGVTYKVNQLAVNKCATIKTSHLNRAGLVENIKHQYKCCLKGGLYGSMATGTASHDLCASKDAQYCELFGANMYSGNVDPSLAEASAPTANPTALPTAFPTAQPTAYPTAQPTGAPTAYPTTMPTAAPTAAIADSVDATTGYSHASKDLVHTKKIHLGDAAKNQAEIDTAITPTTYPTAVPTSAPTAYPTSFPTATPTANPTAFPTPYPTPAPTTYPTPYPTPKKVSAGAGKYCVMVNGKCFLWVSPCSGGCSKVPMPTAKPAWCPGGARYATSAEFSAALPSLNAQKSQFYGKCSASIFDPTHNHCDAGDSFVRITDNGSNELVLICDSA